MLFSLLILSCIFLSVIANTAVSETSSTQPETSSQVETGSTDSPRVDQGATLQALSESLPSTNPTDLSGNALPTTNFPFLVNEAVELSEGNHITLRGEINGLMISKALVELGRMESDEILIYILSPGGSIAAGNTLVQFMNYLRLKGKTLTCVADQAASMAFSIFQECDNRYVTPTSILMQHQMSVGVKDQYENLKSYLRLLDAINEDYLTRESARIGLSKDEFHSKILSDWWLFGDQNVQENVADKLVYVGCSQQLLEAEKVETFDYLGTTYEIVMSLCPLSRAPIRVTEKSSMKEVDAFTFSQVAHSYLEQFPNIQSTKDVKCSF
jgi:ATP-dependent protease ClpP protease subunit